MVHSDRAGWLLATYTLILMRRDINRRQFIDESTAVVAAGAFLGIAPALERTQAGNPQTGAGDPQAGERWYTNAYRRAVIDMHISDWDERFLSEFDPNAYADALVASRSQSIVCYCQSHVGLFNYPTKIGQQHRGWQGRNAFQEMIDACHNRGISVQVYTSLIFDRWAGDQHPEWRIVNTKGKVRSVRSRHNTLCPNSPYRDYVRSFVEEICSTFEFEGIRFDMTFWPAVCYCQHCQQRFDKEYGGELPQTVDWLDQRWVAFQRARERWLAEFASIATGTVRRLRPNASVEHQSSTYPKNWVYGVTKLLAEQNDFLQGDFYGDQLQGSFVRKLLARLSPNLPFGYETSSSVRLQDHTAIKSTALLEAKACSAIADSAAFIFIDAIDPIGTVNLRAHQRMGKIFDKLMPYYEHVGGERVVDVGLYYSFESKFTLQDNGRHVDEHFSEDSHTESTMHVASKLLSNHFPMGVLTKESLSDLPNIKLLVLSNVNMMDEQECQAIREWVHNGGKLLATGATSLVDKSGVKHDNFLLADVFGVKLRRADWSRRNHYLSPTPAGENLFPEFNAKYPAFCDSFGFEVTADEAAEVLATTTLPWSRDEDNYFSSIHSDPPWEKTDSPEIVSHRFGKGQAVYCSSLIENDKIFDKTFLGLVRMLEDDYCIEVTAPRCIEMTLFRQAARGRYTVSLVNFQDQLPNVPVNGIEVMLRIPEAVHRVVRLPKGEEVEFQQQGGRTVFAVPHVDTFEMLAVEVD